MTKATQVFEKLSTIDSGLLLAGATTGYLGSNALTKKLSPKARVALAATGAATGLIGAKTLEKVIK